MSFLVITSIGRTLSKHRTLAAAQKAARTRARRKRKLVFDVVERTTDGQEWLQGTVQWDPENPDAVRGVVWSPV